MMQLPTEDQVMEYVETLSNWSRWGSSFELGTLNYIDDGVRRTALALPTKGVSLSLGRDIDSRPSPEHVVTPPLHLMVDFPRQYDATESPEGGSYDYLGMMLHGIDLTHVDALAHTHFRRDLFGGVPASTTNARDRATRLDVRTMASGIITRGVLIDVPAHLGIDWLEPGQPVTPDMLDDALAASGTTVQRGDAVLLRTGFDRQRVEQSAETGRRHAGWHASCLPWLHERQVAVIGCDTVCECLPSGYTQLRTPIHTIGIARMGLCLVDNMDLRALSASFVGREPLQFLFVMSSLRIVGGTGSPVNPLAIR